MLKQASDPPLEKEGYMKKLRIIFAILAMLCLWGCASSNKKLAESNVPAGEPEVVVFPQMGRIQVQYYLYHSALTGKKLYHVPWMEQ